MCECCGQVRKSAIPLEMSQAGLNAKLEHYKGGSTIVQQGDPLDHLLWVESGKCSAVVCFGDCHVSPQTLPGVPTAGCVRIVAQLTSGDSLGSLVHAMPGAWDLLVGSRTLNTSVTRRTHPLGHDGFWQQSVWQWSVCVPQGEEVRILSYPLASCRLVAAAAAYALTRRAKLEVKWWIAHLKNAAVSEDCHVTPESEIDTAGRVQFGGDGSGDGRRELLQLARPRRQSEVNQNRDHGGAKENDEKSFRPHPSLYGPQFLLVAAGPALRLKPRRHEQEQLIAPLQHAQGHQFHHHSPRHLQLLDHHENSLRHGEHRSHPARGNLSPGLQTTWMLRPLRSAPLELPLLLDPSG